MKLFDLDWTQVLRDLPRWNALSLPARRTLLDELKPHGYVQASRFGASLHAIVASGIPDYQQERGRLWLPDERRELVKVLRAMGRHHLFDQPTPAALLKYIEEHFSNGEIELLGSQGHGVRRGYVTRHILAPRVEFAGWPGDLLDANSDEALAVWATARGMVIDAFTLFILRDLQRIARTLLAFPDGIPLSEIVPQGSDISSSSLASALHTGLGTLVLFAGMRGSDLEPMIGLWPAAAHELVRPPAQPPSVVVPAEQFALAVHMEDMTTLLAAVVAAPVRVRAEDSAVFARARVAIEARLVAPPVWAAHLFVTPYLTRVDAAARELDMLGFVQTRAYHGNPHLQSTAVGAQWLALSPHDRLASLIDPLRKSKEVNPTQDYNIVPAERFFPFSLPYFQAPKSLRLRDALTKAFLAAGDGFIPLEPFLDHAAREANPFRALPPSSAGHGLMYYNDGGDPRETYRTMWRDMLFQFLLNRLIGLGGANIGRLEDGALCFALTDAGRYLLGAGNSFAYGSADTADIVIQPNFDVVFLGAAPSTEAMIARFSQRVGVAPGLVFRITRASVLGAAEAGATADDVLGALRRASSKPMPKNVEREITGWMAAVRRARLRSMEVIECADEEAASRIVALLGAKARRLTPTIFEIDATPSTRAAMVKRLRAGGVFLEDAMVRVEPRPARARRRFEEFEEVWDEET